MKKWAFCLLFALLLCLLPIYAAQGGIRVPLDTEICFSTAICAAYDSDGQMLGSSVTATSDDTVLFVPCDPTQAAQTKIFYLDENGAPLCEPDSAPAFILTGEMKASGVLRFDSSLSAFEMLGDNDNVSLIFTALPTGGTLFYNFGSTDQQKVTLGEIYRFPYASDGPTLRKVKFVPAYTSSKKQTTSTFSFIAFNDEGVAVPGTVTLTINHAARSDYYHDVSRAIYADSVDFLKGQNIMFGTSVGSFLPDDPITRGDFINLLYRCVGEPPHTTSADPFNDLSDSDDRLAIQWAAANGIIHESDPDLTAETDGLSFGPDIAITRQSALVYLYRFDVAYRGNSGELGSAFPLYDYSQVSE